mmetsp:Transcript_59342/g.109722  ORF Transcript_59342/g.109722 Transcript_59342/m.109722 type:complete len:201 (-) Transcript_59342:34-636(-)
MGRRRFLIIGPHKPMSESKHKTACKVGAVVVGAAIGAAGGAALAAAIAPVASAVGTSVSVGAAAATSGAASAVASLQQGEPVVSASAETGPASATAVPNRATLRATLTPEEAREKANQLNLAQVTQVVNGIVSKVVHGIASKLGDLAEFLLQAFQVQTIISGPNTASWLTYYADGLEAGWSEVEAARHATRMVEDEFGSS